MLQKLKNSYHLLQARTAQAFYNSPSRNIAVIGVTGTDGKTTTTSLIYHILKTSGKRVAMISTVGAFIGDTAFDIGFHVTTPSSFALQKYIKKIAEFQNDYLVLEVTSHALDQYRVLGIHFKIGVITNITHEHLDYHKTYDNYLKTKAKLLQSAKKAIINRDDMSYEFLKKLIPSEKVTTYGGDGSINFKNVPFKTTLLGEFNRYNILAAASVCLELGLSLADIQKGISTFTPPIGRQEIIYNKDFTVMVDFAHTPNAFTSLLPGIRNMCRGRLIHVFGAASKRDVAKRPLMGEASARDADIIILTAEDPRGESVEKINEQIEAGIISNNVWEKISKNEILNTTNFDAKKKYYCSVANRKEAIEIAIALAKKGDWVILTGKGHEKSMNLGSGEEEWDEKKFAFAALRKIGKTV